MSYERKPFAFVVPNGTGVLAADDLSATGVHGEYICVKRFELSRLLAVVTTAVVSTGAVVITVTQRLSPGTAAGQVTLGTLSIPAATVLGKEVYKDIDPAVVLPGQTIAFNVTTAAAGGGAAGGAVYAFEAMDRPEQPANLANMLLSA